MDETTTTNEENVGRAHRSLWRAREQLEKLEDRGKRALRDRQAVDAELARALEVDWDSLTLEQIGTAANRIARLAGILRAAELVPRAKELQASARREYDRVRELAP